MPDTPDRLITRRLTDPHIDPFDALEWELRDALIPGREGEPPVFDQRGVEVPASWSQNATNIVAQKYFAGRLGTPERERSVRELIGRVVDRITTEGDAAGYFADADERETFRAELAHILVHQMAAFNSPVWFNIGVEGVPQQCSACFILSVEDSLDSILEWYKEEGLIFKGGSGAGINLSNLRGSSEPLSNGGVSSGPVTFMRGADASAGTITSGGRCLAPWQHVYTATGPRTIKEIADDKHDVVILSWDPPAGRYKAKTARAWASGRKELVRVVTDKGHFDLSADHPVRCTDDVYRPAGTLAAGMSLLSCAVRESADGTPRVGIRDGHGTEEDVVGLLGGDLHHTGTPRPSEPGPADAIATPDLEGDHRVVRIERLGLSEVYDMEVDCPTPDDKSAASGHNFVIWPDDVRTGSGIVVSNTRRAAKMVILDVDHPDIVEFIRCKADEEDKAKTLAAAGFDMSLNTPEGARNWASLQYQNANNSVRVTDEFLQAVERDEEWQLRARRDGSVTATVRARDLMHEIADAAWRSADPGVQYDDTIQDWHTLPKRGRITASNPCSEYMSIDDSSCNLASLNLLKFLGRDGTFDHELFAHVTRVVFLAQEILCAFGDFPTPAITENTRAYRQIGIGFTNLGALLMASGLPYDSEEGRAYAGAVMALLTGESYHTSARIAARVGPWRGYDTDADDMLRVIKKHRQAARQLPAMADQPGLVKAARAAWQQALAAGEAHGFRNAQASVLAPTGTISFLMDADTTGIEPDFSLVKFKKLVGGGSMQIVNQTVPRALTRLGYAPEQISGILSHIEATGAAVGAPGLAEEHLPVFDVAVGERSISPMGHLRMMAACQPFVSGAISKTVNLPAETTVEDIADVYMEGWRLGLKAVAIYRDGTKVAQPLSGATAGTDDEAGTEAGLVRGVRRRLPDDATTHRRHFKIGGVGGYIHVGLQEDGTPGDVFLQISKAGSQLRAWTDVFSVAISLALQYGMPVEEIVEKFSFVSFEPSGFTNDPAIPTARSIVDYLARWMAKEYADPALRPMLGIQTPEERTLQEAEIVLTEDGRDTAAALTDAVITPEEPAPEPAAPAVPAHEVDLVSEGTGSCQRCGGMTRWAGTCQVCTQCGDTSGCG